MATRRFAAGGPPRSVPLLLLVILLHALLVGALLRALDREAPDATPGTDGGVLLLDLPATQDDADRSPRDATAPAQPAVDDSRLPAAGVAPVPGNARGPIRATGTRPASPPRPAPTGRDIDWYSTGEAVARDFAARLDRPSTRPLDRRPARPAAPAKRAPKSVFDDESTRVGRITQNADGETIYWLTPNCYVSLGSNSVALRDVHAAREGVTFCRIPLGKRDARGDLFEEMPTQRGSRYAEKYDPASTEPQPVR